MPDDIKTPKTPTPEEIQSKANSEAAVSYKEAVNGKFTDGKRIAKVLKYTPSRLTGGQARQCFLVNYGHANVSFFTPCKEFMEQFKPVTDATAAPEPTQDNLPK
jgi:hypothetical protein